MMEVRLRTRLGCSMARTCAIMPPIESADHVHGAQAQGFDQTGRVAGHVTECVRSGGEVPALDGGQIGRGEIVQVRR